jgi:hypothetical protein
MALPCSSAVSSIRLSFVSLFKSSIIPPYTDDVTVEEDQISTDMAEKRSVAMSQMQRRQYTQEFGYLAVGDNPWYCFWNSTVEEFWIFLEKEWDGSAASTTSSTAASMTTTGPAYGPNNSWAAQSSSYMPAAATAAATSAVDSDTDEAMPTSAPTPWDGPKPRSFPDVGDGTRFPKMVKMVEKRKPHSNVQPYCQQMEVKPNWQILPIPDVPTVCIEETEYSIPEPTGDSKRWLNRYRSRGDDYTEKLESMCICEWMSGE